MKTKQLWELPPQAWPRPDERRPPKGSDASTKPCHGQALSRQGQSGAPVMDEWERMWHMEEEKEAQESRASSTQTTRRPKQWRQQRRQCLVLTCTQAQTLLWWWMWGKEASLQSSQSFQKKIRLSPQNICLLPTSTGSSKKARVPEKYLLLLYWLCQSLWLCGSQQTVENSERNGTTRPPDLPLEKHICRSGSNS